MEKSNNQENELAVSRITQQKASLYGIASVLVGTGMVPNKKQMKKVVKRLRREVIKDIGECGGEELLMQNRGAIEMVVQGIKRDPRHTSKVRKQLLRTVVDDWYGSYSRGLHSLGWDGLI